MNKRFFSEVLLGMVLGSAGCDTVAELTFEQEQMIEPVVQGFVQARCAAQDQADVALRFSMRTSLDAPVMPGKRYAALGDVLEPGQNFTAQDVTLLDGWVFVVDAQGQDQTCATAKDCPEGAACATPQEMGLTSYYYAPQRVCAYATQIKTLSAPKFAHFRNKGLSDTTTVPPKKNDGRTFAFVLDNSASLDGSGETGIPDNTKATDPWQYRKVGLNQFMDGLLLSDPDEGRYDFSAHFANGTKAQGVFDPSPAWLRTIPLWNSTVMAHYPSPSGGSPIWEAATLALQKLLDTAQPSYARHMIALTDGAPNPNTEDALEAFKRTLSMADTLPMHWLELTAQGAHRPYAEVVQMACGTHYIFDSPQQIPQIMRNLALNSASYWEVGVKFSASLPEHHTYRLATHVMVQLGDSAVMYAAQRVNEQTETLDRRFVFSK